MIYGLYEDDRKKYKNVISERMYVLNHSGGCKGRVAGGGIGASEYYRLYKKGETYFIDLNVEDTEMDKVDIQKLQEWAEKWPIEIDESSCKVKENELIGEAVPGSDGEASIAIKEICIQFQSKDGKEYKFYAENRPDNVLAVADLFKKIGVKNYYNIADVSDDSFPINTISGNGFLCDRCSYIIFRNQGRLFFIRPDVKDANKIVLAEIGIEEVRYYRIEGSVHYEQSIYGSGGAKNDYAGAFLGGMLFGTAGALIGSRASESPVSISSSTVKHDDRVVVLCIRRKTKDYYLNFPAEAEDLFDWLVPEKKYDYVISERRRLFEEEDCQLLGKKTNNVITSQKRLVQIPEKQRITLSGETVHENDAVRPIAVGNGGIKCVVCGTVQSSSRKVCFKCGVSFF